MPQAFDPYHKWLGIPKDEQPPHHYRLLAIRVFEDDPDVIQAAADRQMAHLRTYQTGPNGALSQKLLNEVAAARVCLLNPARKTAYDEKLRKELETQTAPATTPPPAAPDSGTVDLGELLEELTAASATQPALKLHSRFHHLPILLGVGIAAAALSITLLVWSIVAVDRQAPVAQPIESVTNKTEHQNPPESPTADHSTQPVPAASTTSTTATPSPVSAINTAEKGHATADAQANRPAAEPTSGGQPDPAPVALPRDIVGLPEESKKWRVPSAARLEELFRQIDETYKINLAGRLAEKIKLANNLLDAAGKTTEPDNRFALCQKAADLAQTAGDATLMLQAVERLGAEFEVDLLANQESRLIAFAANAESEPRIESLVTNADPVIDQLVAEEAYDRAWMLLNAVYLACQTPAGKAFRKSYHDRRQEMQSLLAQWKTVEEARKTIDAQPDATSAHTVLGQWYCFERRDWRKGLPHLAQGEDPAIRQLAAKELQLPLDEALDQIRLADAWWDVAQLAQGQAHEALLLRASYWYQQALPDLPDGLVKTRAQRRMEELAQLVPLVPATPKLLTLAPTDAERAKAYQTRWASHLGLPEVETNAIGMRLVLVPPGEFDMGSRPREVERFLQEALKQNAPSSYIVFLRSETPRHLVRITQPFYLGMHEVTQAQYQQVMGVNPSRATSQGATSPVEGVSWDNAVDFCRLLSELAEEKEAGRRYHLPTEAQWEYACRAGSLAPFYFGADPAQLSTCGWFAENAQDRPHPVGEKSPNPWGLFDMAGNVREWCADRFTADYYQQSPLENPRGPASGAGRVIRGGSFRDAWPGALRSAFRIASPAGGRHDTVGFRVMCEIPKKRSP
jgi:formylglycine-generating enzyme required for sulfatase activity